MKSKDSRPVRHGEGGDQCVDCGDLRTKNSEYCAPCVIGNALDREGRDRHKEGWSSGFQAGFKEGIATGVKAAMQAEEHSNVIETAMAHKNYIGIGKELLKILSGDTP